MHEHFEGPGLKGLGTTNLDEWVGTQKWISGSNNLLPFNIYQLKQYANVKMTGIGLSLISTLDSWLN